MPRAFTHSSPDVSADQREAWYFTGARDEAKSLLLLLGKNGDTLDSIKELIRVGPEEEAILREFAHECPELAEQIEGALRYRVQVAEEFEKLAKREGTHNENENSERNICSVANPAPVADCG